MRITAPTGGSQVVSGKQMAVAKGEGDVLRDGVAGEKIQLAAHEPTGAGGNRPDYFHSLADCGWDLYWA